MTKISVYLGSSCLISVFSVSAYALNSNQFQQRIQMLKQAQSKTDFRLKNLGVPSRLETDFGLGSEPKKEEEEEKKSLFVNHDDGKQLKAPAGKLLFGKTLNALMVSGEDVPAIVELEEGQGTFSGLRALGRARLSGTEGRIAIEVSRIVSRGGRTFSVKGSVQDDSGAYGLQAQVLSSKAWATVGAIASSFISGLAASQQTMTPGGFGFQEVQPTGRNALLQGVGQTAADQSKRLIDQATQEKPILLAQSGTSVILYLEEEVRF